MAEPFPDRLKRLAHERGESIERVGLAAYDPNIEGTSLANLRKVIRGQRPLNAALIERVAAALGVPATEFPEYRLALARDSLDERVVGLEAALDQLTLIDSALARGHGRRAAEREQSSPPRLQGDRPARPSNHEAG